VSCNFFLEKKKEEGEIEGSHACAVERANYEESFLNLKLRLL